MRKVGLSDHDIERAARVYHEVGDDWHPVPSALSQVQRRAPDRR